jgi:clan AA aspartic protease (TIGR02281 family)
VLTRVVLAYAVLISGGGLSLAGAQGLTKCVAGQTVTDREGKTGVIIADDSKLCQVKYPDGQIYSWIFWNLQPAAGPSKSASAIPETRLPALSNPVPSSENVQSPTVLKPSSNRTLVYPADRLGHVAFTAMVNGAPVRFLVDTGASRVTLTPEAARAAGVELGQLAFTQRTMTANGLAREAPVTLREIRIEQLSIDNVPAAVNENLRISLLGMSFLRRLKSFEMREGALTISW